MENEPALSLKKVSKAFGDAPVLEDLSFDVYRGEFMVLLGPSGCGKTTCLRIVAGLCRPDGGSVSIQGRVVNQPEIIVPPEKRKVGMVFQNLALWPHMTVLGNLKFVLKGLSLGWRERKRRIERILALVRMERHRKKLPGQLSGGEAQRVAIARALVTEPSLFLLDEPLANLDEHLRGQIMENLLQIQEELQITVLYVCHSQMEAFRLAQRVAVLHGGRLVQIGSPLEVYRNPADSFIASFIGAANLFHGSRKEGGIIETPLGEVSMSVPGEKERVLLALRPEAIRLSTNGEGIMGTVKECIYQGDRWLLKVQCKDEILQVRSDRDRPLESEIFLSMEQDPVVVQESVEELS